MFFNFVFQTIYAVVLFIYIIKSGVAKKTKMERAHTFLCKNIFVIQPRCARLHGPEGAGRGLRSRSRAYATTSFPRGLHKPISYNYAKTFFIWFLTSIKTVSKNTIVEKDTFSLRINDF